jgi:DNA polymerase-3 subunit alpha
MTYDMGNTDKLQVFAAEAQRTGVPVDPPCVNRSGPTFEVAGGRILYALSALKNVGRAAIEHLEAARREAGPFRSLSVFARRVDARHLNKRALEGLIKAGAFDALEPHRARLLAGVELLLAASNRAAEASAAGQNDLFGGAAVQDELKLPEAEPWLPMEKLGHEFEAVGFYVSGHPLDDYMPALPRLGAETWAAFRDKALKGATAAKLVGTVTHRQERRSAKSGNKFAFVGFSDPTGQYETICFSDTLAAARDLLEPGKALILRVEADVDGEEVKLRLQGVEPLDKATAGMSQGLTIFVAEKPPLDSIAARLKNGGRSPVHIVVQMPGGRETRIALGAKFTVSPAVKGAIKSIPGVVEVVDL